MFNNYKLIFWRLSMSFLLWFGFPSISTDAVITIKLSNGEGGICTIFKLSCRCPIFEKHWHGHECRRWQSAVSQSGRDETFTKSGDSLAVAAESLAGSISVFTTYKRLWPSISSPNGPTIAESSLDEDHQCSINAVIPFVCRTHSGLNR